MSALDAVLKNDYWSEERIAEARAELAALREKLTALEYGQVLHAGELARREANNEELRARETCTGCGMRKIGAILAIMGGAVACCPDCSTLTLDERSEIRKAASRLRRYGQSAPK